MSKKIIITESQRRLLPEGINVWHGSDRNFDKFDIDKVGSGDGKSLGGWGIYFSDSREVSERYFTSNGFVDEYELRTGKYFDLDDQVSEYGMIRGLENMGIDEDEIEEFQTDYIEQSQNYGDVTNKQAYEWLSFVLGGEKEASQFLKSLGYIGNTFMDKWNTDARNYVVFDINTIIQ